MKTKNQILKAIRDQREQSAKKKKFEGTFIDYIELLKDNPELVQSAHKRLCNALEKHGVNKLQDSDPRKSKVFDNEALKVYDYFKDEFFGMEKVIAKLMRFLKSASLRGEENDLSKIYLLFSIEVEGTNISSIILLIFSFDSFEERIVILSTKFLNSLTFPGQLYVYKLSLFISIFGF